MDAVEDVSLFPCQLISAIRMRVQGTEPRHNLDQYLDQDLNEDLDQNLEQDVNQDLDRGSKGVT